MDAKTFNADINHHLLFPSRLMTLLFNDTQELDNELTQLFEKNDYTNRDEYFESSDDKNITDLANTSPAMAKLKDMFLFALNHWIAEEKISGNYKVLMNMFPVYYTNPQQFVPAHNHGAHITCIYYIRAPNPENQPIVLEGKAGTYFKLDKGALIVHDPRFNASLMQLTDDDHVKVVPRAGLMVLMPGYLWHTGTPSSAESYRLGVAADFKLSVRSDDEQWTTLDIAFPKASTPT